MTSCRSKKSGAAAPAAASAPVIAPATAASSPKSAPAVAPAVATATATSPAAVAAAPVVMQPVAVQQPMALAPPVLIVAQQAATAAALEPLSNEAINEMRVVDLKAAFKQYGLVSNSLRSHVLYLMCSSVIALHCMVNH